MILVGNGSLVTRDPERPWLSRGAVAADDRGSSAR